jgi:hypothetical protein
MDPALIGTIISGLSGAAGGVGAGGLFKNLSLGLAGNAISGILGGGIVGKLAGGAIGAALGAKAGNPFDVMSIISNLISGGLGGGGLMAVVGLVRSMLAK